MNRISNTLVRLIIAALFSVTLTVTATEPVHPVNNEALGYVCKGGFHPITPFGFTPKQLYKTQMQEAMAPQPINLSDFDGQLIQLHWQVAEGETLWGVSAARVNPAQLHIRWKTNDQPLKIEKLPQK